MQVEKTARRSRLSMDELKTISIMANDNKTAKDIAEATGIAHQTILRVIGGRGYVEQYKQYKQTNTVAYKSPSKKIKMSDDDVIKSVKMLSNNVSIKDVAKQFGVSEVHIMNIAKGRVRESVTGFDRGRHNILSMAKLTKEDIKDIKYNVKNKASVSKIAETYNISSKLVVGIVGTPKRNSKVEINTPTSHKVKFTDGPLKEALKIVSNAVVDIETEINEAQKLHSIITKANYSITNNMGLLTELDKLITTKKAQLEVIKTITK